MLQQNSGIKLTHVPYKGTPPMMTDLLEGAVDISFDFLGAAKPYLDAKMLKSLAVTGADRLKELPAIPTIKESGYQDSVLDV